MKNRILFAIITLLVLASCSSSKDSRLAYFKTLNEKDGVLANIDDKYIIRVLPDDELIITVTSSVPEATAMYNVPLGNPSTRGNVTMSSQPRLQTYIVDTNGEIEMPILGKLKVQGMTTNEVAEMIKGKVSQNVKDPFVRVELIQFGVMSWEKCKAHTELKSTSNASLYLMRFLQPATLPSMQNVTTYS